MSFDFRDIVIAMAQERPNARVGTIVALALAVENATPGDLDDVSSLARWASRQPTIVKALKEPSRIPAIKELRTLTGASLLQAKNAIDAVTP